MALLSPGVEVTVIDESFFAPIVSTSIPYILLATAQDKTDSAGTVAPGTTAANANVVTPVSSRRELVSLFGNPSFVAASTGGVVQGHELNEYGLQVAYSVLGVTNRVYVQRADIDMGQLSGTAIRPTNTPANGTTWLDLGNTDFGIFEWSATDQTFNKITPIIIIEDSDHSGGTPNNDIGTLGSYCVVAAVATNNVYYKDPVTFGWVLVGSAAWEAANYTVQGTVANGTIIGTDTITINGVVTIAGATTVTDLVADIITAQGVAGSPTADGWTPVNEDGKLTIYADRDAVNGEIVISGDNTILTVLGITAGTHEIPALQQSKHTSVPTWKSGDASPRPTGSVWIKTTSPNLGADFYVSVFNAVTEEWNRVDAPLYYSHAEANNALDATGGGFNIGTGSLYVRYDTVEDGTATYIINERAFAGATNITGSVTTFVDSVTLTDNDTFNVQVSEKGSDTYTVAATIDIGATANATTFVQAIIDANIDGLTANVETSGAITITHEYGGSIILTEDDAGSLQGTPLVDAGFTEAVVGIEDGNLAGTESSHLILSNWIPLDDSVVPYNYTASSTQPSVDPADGTKWYYSDVDQVDIMIHNGSIWKGYLNVTSDARNADLSLTDKFGPTISASEPTLNQSGAALVVGDIWIDTSSINDYPIINRYEDLGGGAGNGWVTLDNADATSENGILFADARWDTDGTTDVITADLPIIADGAQVADDGVTLLSSDWVDPDAPDPALYPRGTLLWNTRRSGYNVKQYTTDYLTTSNFDTGNTETNTWRTVSGLKFDGSPYMGSGAVRNMVVQAMKSGVDSSIDAREERTTINLLTAPGYSELIANLIKVNTDRKDTAFVIGDSPMTLASTSLALQNWASNANLAADNGTDGLISTSEYLGVYYPSGLSNDLDGNAVVMPSSHMSLRTMIRSDNVSYPWIAPAGVRRGKVDNATSIGYIDIATGEYQSIGVGEGTRDVLYTNNVNPISILPGSGITVYGQKTRAGIASSLDRINVARLTANLRYVLSLLSRPFIFEPNDKLTRDEFKNEIEKYLNELVTKRGIFDYLVVCDDSNNTPARIDRNELWADVAIEPVKAAEFIFVPLRLKNTGEI